MDRSITARQFRRVGSGGVTVLVVLVGENCINEELDYWQWGAGLFGPRLEADSEHEPLDS
jgi:hypothetical protein